VDTIVLAHESKCAMCGKKVFVSDELEKQKEKDEQPENNSASPNRILEQIDGSWYTFDTVDCAMMFKRFSSIYGSSFADE
jgi:hypothetical protein